MSGSKGRTPTHTNDMHHNLCTSCNQPIISPQISSYITPAYNGPKRKSRVTFDQRQQVSTPSSNEGPYAKRLRRFTDEPSGKCSRIWSPGLPVWVRIYIGDGIERGWVTGKVNNVFDIGSDEYTIEVVVQNMEEEWVIPRTINHYNYDPIPSKLGCKLSQYITQRNESLEEMKTIDVKHYKCIQYHMGGVIDETQLGNQDIIGKSLLGDDPESRSSLRNLLLSLMVDKNVKHIVDIVTGGETCSPQLALAYFVGQLCGIELSDASETSDPKRMLNQLVSRDDDDTNIDCPLAQVFLMSVMSTRTKKSNKIDPTNPLYDNRAREVLNDPKRLKVRMGRLETALAAMHASQSDKPSVTGPSFALLSHGIHLMMDMKGGTSDKVLDTLADKGICRKPDVLRHHIREITDSIDVLNARTPLPNGEVDVVAYTADNADMKIFHGCESVVPVGNVLLGSESKEDNDHFNQNYMKGLPSVSEVTVQDLIATKEEDDIAQEVIDNQNVLAILTAALEYDTLSACSDSDRNKRSIARPDIDTDINFRYRSKDRTGIVKGSTARTVSVEFVDGGRTVTKDIPLKDIIADTNDDDTNTTTSTTTNDDNNNGMQVDDAQNPTMFHGERHRFRPSTTTITSVAPKHVLLLVLVEKNISGLIQNQFKYHVWTYKMN